MRKQRSSNIELCRIAAILLVILVHSATYTQGSLTSYDDCHIPSLFMRGFAVIGVDVFVIISGYFGITWKRNSLISLFYIVLFYGLLRAIALCKLGMWDWKALFVVSSANWYVVTYLGLVIVSPILNSFTEIASKKQFGIVLGLLILYQTWMGWVPGLPHYESFRGGYSLMSFFILYLLARYIRINGVPSTIEKNCGVLYIFISLSIGFFAFFGVKYGFSGIPLLFKYNSPFVILSAICFFLFFLKLQIGYNKIINYFASSTLSVLLIHEPRPFRFIMKDMFGNLTEMGGGYLIIWFVLVVAVYFICVLIDQLRILSFEMINKYIENNERTIDNKAS